MHFHRAYELYFILTGSRDYFVEEHFFKVGEGDLVIVPSEALHRTAGKGATRILIYFTPEFLSEFFSAPICEMLTACLKPTICHPGSAERERMLDIMNTLLRDYEQYQREKTQEAKSVCAVHLLNLLQLIRELPLSAAPEKEFPDPRIAQIVKFINENYSEISTVDDVAGKFYMSKYYFCKLFRKNIGVPLFTYLNTIKVQQACAIMREGPCSLTEIATRCGFNTSSYFCKVFKSIMGISPSQYRKQKF